MPKFFYLLVLSLLFLTGCRTYVGSETHIRRDTPRYVFDDAERTDEKYGVNCNWHWKHTVLTFGTACNYNYRREVFEWETGRTEYYLKPEKDEFTEDGRGFNPIAWPFYILGDTVCLIFHDWHLKGEGPVFWYTAAYLPPLSWLNAPFMRPPYSYREKIEYTTEEVKYPTPKLKVRRITPIIEERFDPDTSRSEIDISCEGKTISRQLNEHGKISFHFSDLGINGIFPPRVLKFEICHRNREQIWNAEIFSLCTPDLLRDWNLVANEQFDFYARIHALYRLKPAIGVEAYNTLIKKLYAEEPLDLKPIAEAESKLNE